jgi:hypothetical protein
MQYEKTTGTFYTDEEAICRGFYGTETHTLNTMTLTPPATRFWSITEAKNGTGLRLFSLSKEEWNLYKFYETKDGRTFERVPWRESTDRVWILATFKNLEGHLGTWSNKKKTFGQMFEEILGEEGIQAVCQSTSTELCISYFMRHRDNDIHKEMGDEPSHVIQTIIWNRRLQQYSGPSFPLYHKDFSNLPYWITPPPQVRSPTMISFNSQLNLAENDPETFFKEGGDFQIIDGHPLLLTVFDGPTIRSFKLITPADEYVRTFRSRSHNRFVALCIVENLFSQTNEAQYLEEMTFAKDRLFTQEELDGYIVNIQSGKDEFYNELSLKYDGKYVAFDKKIFNTLKIADCLKEIGNIPRADTEAYEAGRERFREMVWERLMKCTNWKKVGALESFWRVYVRAKFD